MAGVSVEGRALIDRESARPWQRRTDASADWDRNIHSEINKKRNNDAAPTRAISFEQTHKKRTISVDGVLSREAKANASYTGIRYELPSLIRFINVPR